MKRILINATQSEELRVAMVDGQLLYDLDIEVPSREQKKSNIYKGTITRVEPSLEAAFVNYGADRHGFLPFKEISRHYFAEDAKSDDGRYNIKDAVKEGQEIIIQVEKEERGNKGAALTTFVSLAGRFLVAMPQNPRAGGVSRRIEGEERDSIRNIMSELVMPAGMGVIARTAGVGRTTEEMQWDLDYLTQLWAAVEKAASERPAPFLIYQESDIVIRALRDHYKSDIGEIIIDSKDAYERAYEFMSMVMPNALHKLKKFDDKLPLFNRFQIESQIESAFAREVNLSSGGAIVIDHTEALISIDVNSARATKGSDIEDTALHTNLEAADEIARQLRIRDLGGLIVIDFIDMMKNKNQRDVEQRLRNAVYEDRARVQIGRISRFGLLEMSRQRLRPSIGESSQIVCPRCCGQGSIRDVESLSLSIMRLLEEDALKENTGRLVARLPVVIATYLLNEKRGKFAEIESRYNVHCVIIPDPNLETPHFEIERVRDSDTQRHESSFKSSYEMTSEDPVAYVPEAKSTTAGPAQTAAVQRITPPSPIPQAATPPAPVKTREGGILSKVFHAIFGAAENESESTEKVVAKAPQNDTQNRSPRSNNRNRKRTTQPRTRKAPNNKRTDNRPNKDQESKPGSTRTKERTETTGSTDNKTQQADNTSDRPRRPRKNRGKNTRRNNQDKQQTRNEQAATSTDNSENKAQPDLSQSAKENTPAQDPQSGSQGNQGIDKNVQAAVQADQAPATGASDASSPEARQNEGAKKSGPRPKRARSRNPRKPRGGKPSVRKEQNAQQEPAQGNQAAESTPKTETTNNQESKPASAAPPRSASTSHSQPQSEKAPPVAATSAPVTNQQPAGSVKSSPDRMNATPAATPSASGIQASSPAAVKAAPPSAPATAVVQEPKSASSPPPKALEIKATVEKQERLLAQKTKDKVDHTPPAVIPKTAPVKSETPVNE